MKKRIMAGCGLAVRMLIAAGLTGAGGNVLHAVGAGNGHGDDHEFHDRDHDAPAKLVEIVREHTRRFKNVNALAYTDYKPVFGCVSGPDHGAMGVHYVSGSILSDNELDETRPEALIYEPTRNGMRLVGVEFIVDAATWLKNHDNTPPALEGQAFQLVNSPNRYGLPAFFELHVWAWQDNPNGAFVDWNNNVSCEQK